MLFTNESELIDHYLSIVKTRNKILFSDFLSNGYKITTLDSVRDEFYTSCIFSKIILGMLITLIDDLADSPKTFNPRLLKIIYQLRVDNVKEIELKIQNDEDLQIIRLVHVLIVNLKNQLQNMPHWQILNDLFLFDISQIYLSNKYAELLTAYPFISNLSESKFYGPYNMGMVAAGTIDLMASESIKLEELGQCRECFILAQRMGRIGNLLATFIREQQEGDKTNEIFIFSQIESGSIEQYKDLLLKEHAQGLEKIKNFKEKISFFNTESYADGLAKLLALHLDMQGSI